MKYDTIVRIFCGILLIAGICHTYYSGPDYFLLYPMTASMLLMCSLLKMKKVRTPDRSKLFGIIGIFAVLLSYLMYFVLSLGEYLSPLAEIGIAIGLVAYFCFLMWYKGVN